jgi:hypothetical protein
MSVSFNSTPVLQKYGSKSELHYGLLQPWSRIAQVIREDNIEAQLVNGMIKYNVEQVIGGLNKRWPKRRLYARA